MWDKTNKVFNYLLKAANPSTTKGKKKVKTTITRLSKAIKK